MCTGAPPHPISPPTTQPLPHRTRAALLEAAASPRLPALHTLPQECPATECPGAQRPVCMSPIRAPVPMVRAAQRRRACQNHAIHLASARLHARESAKVGLHRTGAVPAGLSHSTAAHWLQRLPRTLHVPHPRPVLTLPAGFGEAAFCEGCTHAARLTPFHSCFLRLPRLCPARAAAAEGENAFMPPHKDKHTP